MLNGSAAALIGFYLITVLYAGNEDKLLEAIKDEKGFLKWGGALLILFFLYKFAGGGSSQIIQQLTVMALIALFLNKGTPFFKELEQVFTDKKDIKEVAGQDKDKKGFDFSIYQR